MNETIKTILDRKTIRKFTNDPVPQEKPILFWTGQGKRLRSKEETMQLRQFTVITNKAKLNVFQRQLVENLNVIIYCTNRLF